MTGRTPPQDIEAEQAVLGSMLLSSSAIAEVLVELADEHDFYRPAHQAVFEAILDLYGQRQPVDAITVAAEMVRTGTLAKAGGHQYLHTLIEGVPTAANAGYYARIVAERAVARRLVEAGTRIVQMGYGLVDGAELEGVLDETIGRARDEVARVASSRPGAVVRGRVSTWDEMWAHPDSLEDWLVPGLLEMQDVFMLLAEEGLGKSWVSRQFAMCIAAGIHPWWPRSGRDPQRIEPRRTLLVDGEVAESQLRRQSRYIGTHVARAGTWVSRNAYVWTINDGMDLRSARDVRMFESVVADVKPELICLGPIYKMFSRKGDPWDTATEEVRENLDHIRRTYNCTLFLEHHMAKGDGSGRPSTPYGSSEWMRWVSGGLVLEQVAPNAYAFEPFRRFRDPRDFPPGLERSGGSPGTLPWMPIWDADELQFRRDEEARARRAR
jgi:replicative DNA helicase